jgi:hypothetical protein
MISSTFANHCTLDARNAMSAIEEENEEEKPPINQPWIIFPEIIGASIVAIYAPFYLVQMFLAGHILWALLGFVGWLAGVTATVFCLKHRMYFMAIWPMLLVLGVGVLIDQTLFPK